MPALTNAQIMIFHHKKYSHFDITSQKYQIFTQIKRGQRLLFPTVTVPGICSRLMHR